MTKTIVIQDAQTGQILADGEAIKFEGNYYFEVAEVNFESLSEKKNQYHCPIKNADCDYFYLTENSTQEVAWSYKAIPNPDFESIQGKIGFYGKKTKLVEIVEL